MRRSSSIKDDIKGRNCTAQEVIATAVITIFVVVVVLFAHVHVHVLDMDLYHII